MRRVFRLGLWCAGVAAALSIFLAILLQIPTIQTFLARKAADIVADRTGTRVGIGALSVSLRGTIRLESLYIEDAGRDTLISVGYIGVDINPVQLLRKRISVRSVAVHDLYCRVYRSADDSLFNYAVLLGDGGNGTDSSADDPAGEQAGAPPDISLGKIDLKNIVLQYQDDMTESTASLRLASFDAIFKKFDISRMQYRLDTIGIDGLQAAIRIPRVPNDQPAAKDDRNSQMPDIGFDQLTITNLQTEYRNPATGEYISLSWEELSVLTRAIDLPSRRVEVSDFYLDALAARYEFSESEREPAEGPAVQGTPHNAPDKQGADGWNIILDRFRIQDSGMRMVNRTSPDISGVLNPDRIDLTGIYIDMENIIYGEERLAVGINDLRFAESSGVVISRTEGLLFAEQETAGIEGFILQTPGSKVMLDALIQYRSFDDLMENIRDVEVQRLVLEVEADPDDIRLLSPDLDSLLAGVPAGTKPIALRTAVSGNITDLHIQHFEVDAGESTRLRAEGTILGLPEPDSVRYDVRVTSFVSDEQDIRTYIPFDLLSEDIRLPDTLSLSAGFSGTARRIEGIASVKSSFGEIETDLQLQLSEIAGPSYRGYAEVRNFNAGALFDRRDIAGKLTMRLDVDASGSEPDNLAGNVSVRIESIELLGYVYEDIRLEVNASGGGIGGDLRIADENMELELDASVQFSGPAPRYSFELDLSGMNLDELNITDDAISLRTRISADIQIGRGEDIDGILRVSDFQLSKNGRAYSIDTLSIAASSEEGFQKLRVESSFLEGSYAGNVSFGDLPEELFRHVDKYFNLHESVPPQDSTEKRFEFNISLTDPGIIPAELIPDLSEISQFTLNGIYESERSRLNVSMDLPSIRYAGISIDSLIIRIDTDEESAQGSLRLGRVDGPAVTVFGPEVSVSVSDNTLMPVLRAQDEARRDILVIRSTVQSADTAYVISLDTGAVILNGEEWFPVHDNALIIGGARPRFQNLRIERDEAFISAHTPDDTTTFIEIADFPLGALIGNFQSEFDELDAILSGSIVLTGSHDVTLFHSELTFSDIIFGPDTIGTLNAEMRSETADEYSVNIALRRQDDYLGMQGSVRTEPDETLLDLSIELDQFHISNFEPFTLGRIRESQGTLSGSMTVRGGAGNPVLNGHLRFTDARVFITALNTSFGFGSEPIRFDNSGIQFRSFTITDRRGNTASINGSMVTDSPEGIVFMLTIRSNDFLLLNTGPDENDLLYGTIILDSDLRLRGHIENPEINATIGLRQGTELTFVVPESDPVLIDRERIVDFRTVADSADPGPAPETEADTLRSGLRGFNISANIQVDPQAEFTVIIDPQAGDYVRIRGGGALSYGVDPGGLMSLAGRYEITDGTYQLSFYEIARRRFDIRPGSSIHWTGDPLNAEIDMSAIYTVRTSPLELVADQVGDQAAQQYRRAMPFQVYLNLKGDLLKPDISFELDMPEDQRGVHGGTVYTRIQQLNQNETEKNKQVFALLVLNRFIAANPFDIPEGGGLSATARTSGSKFLTQQLNVLSGRYIRGIDIDFEVQSYEDYSADGSEGRTELQIQLSRRFLDDRLAVEVGGHIELEGERKRQSGISDIAGDMAVEYMLTQDGRYRIRGFRRTEYQSFFDGDLISTGLSLVYTRDFNSFRELFKRDRRLEPVETPEPDVVGRDE